jgi:Flp pilus assembly protein TadD
MQNLLNKGCKQIEQGDFSQATVTFEKLLELHPTNNEFCAYLGEAYFLNQEYEKARATFKHRDDLVLQNDPLTPYIEGYRGCILFEEQKYEQALPYLEQAIAKQIKEPEIYYRLGILYMIRGQLAQAHKILQQIDQIDPAFSYRKIKKLNEEIWSLTQHKA